MLTFREYIKETIGPHENKELSLMLQGKKPAALIAMDKGKFDHFKPHIENGRFIHTTGKLYNNHQFHIIAQQGEEERLNRLHDIFSGPTRPHREIGKLLGYTDEDINHFMTKNNIQEKYIGPAVRYHFRALDKMVTGGKSMSKTKKILAHTGRAAALMSSTATTGAITAQQMGETRPGAIAASALIGASSLVVPHVIDIIKMRKNLKQKDK